MRGNNYSCVITCKYHNGTYGMHAPVQSLSERGLMENPIAVGRINEDKRRIEVAHYIPHFLKCLKEEQGCVNCRYAKLYNKNGNGEWKERNGTSKKIRNYELKLSEDGMVMPQELYEILRELSFPFNFTS